MKKLLFLSALFFFYSFLLQAKSNTDIEVKIAVKNIDNYLYITAISSNTSKSNLNSLQYRLFTKKESVYHNVSKNVQSGSFELNAYENKIISQQKISAEENAKLYIKLEIIKDGKPILEKTIDIKDLRNIKSTYSNEIGLNVPNLIFKDTRSKEAETFMKHFVELYKSVPKNEQQSMFITETPTGKLNKIQVYLSEIKVYEFYVLPRDAYLFAAAQETIKRLPGQHSI